MHRCLVLIVVAVACAAGGAQAGQVRSGLHGAVVQQIGGACAEGTDCTSPAPGIMLAFSRNGGTVRARTGLDGSYWVRLSPGAYSVYVVGEGTRVKIQPSTALVRSARFRDLDFTVSGRLVP